MAESGPFSGREGSCVTGCLEGKVQAAVGGKEGAPGRVFRRLRPPGWPLGPGTPEPWRLASLAGREPRKRRAVVFSWVMGHHDSFSFRNPI